MFFNGYKWEPINALEGAFFALFCPALRVLLCAAESQHASIFFLCAGDSAAAPAVQEILVQQQQMLQQYDPNNPF
jgi:hypothetical protein